jgi:hypothetical protein
MEVGDFVLISSAKSTDSFTVFNVTETTTDLYNINTKVTVSFRRKVLLDKASLKCTVNRGSKTIKIFLIK